MRNVIICVCMMLSFGARGQADSLLNIAIMSKRPLPQIGMGTDGKKYFVMSTNQDKRTLIELRKELYKDSMLVYYEGLNVTNMREISLLKERLKDRGEVIDKNRLTIKALEENVQDHQSKMVICEKNNRDLKQYIRRKRAGWWFAMAIGVAGTALYIDQRLSP